MFKELLRTELTRLLYIYIRQSIENYILCHTLHLKNIKAIGKLRENKTIFVLKIYLKMNKLFRSFRNC